MRFLESTDLLKIEDILPFFPDFVVIDDFKDEIANALESYSNQIESLKNEMDDTTRSAEAMKESITGLKDRFITVDAGERCSVCSFPILSRQFYVFPCHHAFHADCLVGLVGTHLLSDYCTMSSLLLRQGSISPHTHSDGYLPFKTKLSRGRLVQLIAVMPLQSTATLPPGNLECSERCFLKTLHRLRKMGTVKPTP
jgi:Vacuolar sorting protein 39 domain 2